MGDPFERWNKITLRRAAILRDLADGLTEPRVAEALGLTLPIVRGQVEQLKNLTGCVSVRQLGRWWRANRREWVLAAVAAGGLRLPEPDSGEKRGG